MIYVDEGFDYKSATGYGLPGVWAHMITDGDLEELHAMADQIGLSINYFQGHPIHPHYDLTPNKRKEAIKRGATPVSKKHLAVIQLTRAGMWPHKSHNVP